MDKVKSAFWILYFLYTLVNIVQLGLNPAGSTPLTATGLPKEVFGIIRWWLLLFALMYVVYHYARKQPVLSQKLWKILMFFFMGIFCYDVVPSEYQNAVKIDKGPALFFTLGSLIVWYPGVWAFLRYPFSEEIWDKKK